LNNRWKFTQNINSVFPLEEYSIGKPKEQLIEPKRIISLSRTFNELLNDGQIPMLRDEINKNGYRMNPTSKGGYVSLFEDPDGNYYVKSGNHRAIVAYDLNIPQIPALVQKIKPKRFRIIKAFIKK
jgi:hypothetical protein